MNEPVLTFESELNIILPLPLISRGSRWPEPSMNFLIAYDIADPKRLSRVAKSLERNARRVQKSVFMFTGTRRQVEAVISNLVQVIEPTEDRVQAWPIRTSTRALRIDAGNAIPDTGVALIFGDQQWTVIEAMDDAEDHEPLIIE